VAPGTRAELERIAKAEGRLLAYVSRDALDEYVARRILASRCSRPSRARAAEKAATTKGRTRKLLFPWAAPKEAAAVKKPGAKKTTAAKKTTSPKHVFANRHTMCRNRWRRRTSGGRMPLVTARSSERGAFVAAVSFA
jgi:hypothetical protein